MRTRGSTRGGFTLVEAIASMVILAVIGSLMSALIVRAGDSYARTAVAGRLQSQLGAAMTRVHHELISIPRRAGGGTPAPDITSIAPAAITFRGNWSLSLVNGELMLSEAGATAQPLLRDVTAFQVRALDALGVQLSENLSGSAVDAVRRIQVTITVAANGQSETLRTRAFIRALQVSSGG